MVKAKSKAASSPVRKFTNPGISKLSRRNSVRELISKFDNCEKNIPPSPARNKIRKNKSNSDSNQPSIRSFFYNKIEKGNLPWTICVAGHIYLDWYPYVWMYMSGYMSGCLGQIYHIVMNCQLNCDIVTDDFEEPWSVMTNLYAWPNIIDQKNANLILNYCFKNVYDIPYLWQIFNWP